MIFTPAGINPQARSIFVRCMPCTSRFRCMPVLLGTLLSLTLARAVHGQVPCDVSVQVVPPTCPDGSDGSITVVPNTPGQYTYVWAHDPGLNGPAATGLSVGPYSVTVFDTTGCFSQIDTVVAPPNLPPMGTLTTTNISCAGANDGSVTLTLNGPYTFEWLDAPNLTDLTRTGLGPGVYEVNIYGGPCPSWIYANLGDPTIQISVGGNLAYCPSDPPVLTAEGQWGFSPDVYAWSTGDSTASFQVPVGTAGPIDLVAIDTTIGCTNTASVTLSLLTPPTSTFHVPDTLCLRTWDTAILLSSNADSLAWHWGADGFSNDSFPTILFDEPFWQPISLQSFDADGCGDEGVRDSVYVRPRLPATFTAEQVPCTPRVALHFESTSDSCAFFVGDRLVLNQCSGFNEVDLERYGEYDFTFYSTQPDQCDDTATVRIDVRTAPTAFLPNAFTPNGDDINDRWPGPLDIPDLKYQVEIFDRWGHFVWSTTDTAETWDGGGLPMGVYIYRMTMLDPCNETDELKRDGFITLFR